MAEPLRSARGGFLRSSGCGEFIRELLLGNGPGGSPKIDPEAGVLYTPEKEVRHRCCGVVKRGSFRN